MNDKNFKGWKELLKDFPWFEGKDKYPLPAYSEFMPSPKKGINPFGEVDNNILKEEDIHGWYITELEEEYELKPGMDHIGRQTFCHIINLAKGKHVAHISGHANQNIINNPYWTPELAEHTPNLVNERFVMFLPMMLSRTQDDKGRVRWTFFGGSENGPEHAFWRSFYTSPNEEISEKKSLQFISDILNGAYNEKIDSLSQLNNIGFRILPTESSANLPSWTKQLIIDDKASFDNVKYLLTFKPFSTLPEEVKKRYFDNKLALLPFPGSLVFWGMQSFLNLKKDLPMAMQIPLLRNVARHSGNGGVRVPQSGWIHEHHPDVKHSDVHQSLLNDSYHRTHRWQRVMKHDDELKMEPRLAKIAKVLFSTDLETMGLYDKPLARNCQLWTKDYKLLIDGPNATYYDIKKAEQIIEAGGLFGYRFFYPPMQAGNHHIYWHRPFVAYLSHKTNETETLPESLLGYIAAYPADERDLNKVIELYPRLYKREIYLDAIHSFNSRHDHYAHQTAHNIINVLYHSTLLGNSLPKDFVRHLIRVNKKETLEQWFNELDCKANDITKAHKIKEELNKVIDVSPEANQLPEAITYNITSKRNFEEAWWNDIHFLAHGKFINKDNADCLQDTDTYKHLKHHHRDLEQLGDYLIERHKAEIMKAGMEGKAFVGELPFKWITDFDFSAFGGWENNKKGKTYERNILVVIPGKNRSEAIVMGDHYDTAYMEDVYDKDNGGAGARISAAGADDNYSATSTLLQAASIFLKMSQEGKLERDVWLIHLTGEEFPSDCMGARNFCKINLEKSIKLFVDKDKSIDLSGTKVIGTYVMDMIGHNKDTDKDIFQISPGKSMRSVKLAYHAHVANMIWNANTHEWNHSHDRLHCKAGVRTDKSMKIPDTAKHLSVKGEVRTQFDAHSSIYNTDGQIFSDLGIPVVLFMENYDLHRTGYHDQHDTMENIDLDYGAAVAAIAIESVARVATTESL